MRLKQIMAIVFGCSLALGSGSVLANANKQISAFVKLNSWYCEKPVSSASDLAKSFKADNRLQASRAEPGQFTWQAAGETVSLMAHSKGCTTVTQLDGADKLALNPLINALAEHGYKKLSQKVGYGQSNGQKVMVSETVMQHGNHRAVLIYPMDDKGPQQVSLTTANYGMTKTADAPNKVDSDKVEMHRKLAGSKGDNGWYRAKSTKGDFSVLMPLKFNDYTVNGKGDVRSIEMLSTRSEEGLKFWASRTYYNKAGMAQTLFEKFQNGEAVPKAPRKKLKHLGYDAVLIEASDKQNATSQLVMKVGQTLILLAVEWPVKYNESAKKLGNVFFNSLKAK